MNRRNMPHPRKQPPITDQSAKISRLVTALLLWFEKNARDLPWRQTNDPYAIWVSEIMLQQTQVKTVLGYWERWMAELPNVKSLAKASPAKIHKLWEGLGYYTRVRNMQKAAKEIVVSHGGKFPADYEAILELPGIGRYTAGAIASIAFNQPRPILDGNVMRVLARIFGISGNAREKPANEKLWSLAEALVTAASRQLPHGAKNCSNLNQSLMELGALICAPRQPKCGVCPVRRACKALQTGRVEELPTLGKRIAATPRRFAAFVVKHRGHWLVRQRPAGAVNAHLWEFPNVEIRGESFELKKLAKDEMGFTPSKPRKLGVIKHTITRYRITLEVYRVKMGRGEVKSVTGGRWQTVKELGELAFTSAHRRILKRLTQPTGNRLVKGQGGSMLR
jgi:A/G-specific adenine glycosylase